MSWFDVDDAIRFVREAQQIALAFDLTHAMEPRRFDTRGRVWGFETQGMWNWDTPESRKRFNLIILQNSSRREISLLLIRNTRSFAVDLNVGAIAWDDSEEFSFTRPMVLLMAKGLFKLGYDIAVLENHFALHITPQKKLRWLLEMEGARARCLDNARRRSSQINSFLDPTI